LNQNTGDRIQKSEWGRKDLRKKSEFQYSRKVESTPRHPELDSGSRISAPWDCYEIEDGY